MSDSEIADMSNSNESLNEGSSASPQAASVLERRFASPASSGFPGGGSHLDDGTGSSPQQDMDLVMDIPVSLSVELGRTKVPIKQLLHLAQGSVIELEASAGDPMDVYVNGCLIALGEVVVTNEKFGIRLTDIVTPAERMQRLKKR